MDETGLKGVYSFAAETRPQGPIAESGVRKGAAPKGGLTLDTRKLPIERVVVDHVDKAPSAN